MVLVHLTRLRRGSARSRRGQDGAVALLSTTFAVVMFGLAAMVVDLGQARVVRGEAQAASDASALAAGNALYLAGTRTANVPAAVTAAKTYALQNYQVQDADWASCDDPAPLAVQPAATECISFDHATQPTKVRVRVPVRDVSLVFGPLFGTDTVNITAEAEATVSIGGRSNCGLCVIGTGYHDFQNGDAYISGGNVSINGSVNIQNNGLVSTDGYILVEGAATGPLDGYTPDPTTGQPRIDDPLADYPLPSDFSAMNAYTNPCTQGPGIYGATNFPNGTCTLQPGLYVITGEWDFSGTSGLDATSGVTLYFTCGSTSTPSPCNAPGQDGGWLDAAGNGNISITAPTSGSTAGMAIAYDRQNIRYLNLSGNGSGTLVGTVYAVSGRMRYDGNGCARTNQSLIVVGELEFNGNPACLKTDYVMEKNVEIPPGQLHLSE